MYRRTTGAIVLDTVNPGDVVRWVTDANFVIRRGEPWPPIPPIRARCCASVTARMLPADLLDLALRRGAGPVAFTLDGKNMYLTTTMDSDTSRLVKIDLATGKELETLAKNPERYRGGGGTSRYAPGSGSGFLLHNFGMADPGSFHQGRQRGPFQNPAGEYGVTSRDRADKTWIVSYQRDDGPVASTPTIAPPGRRNCSS